MTYLCSFFLLDIAYIFPSKLSPRINFRKYSTAPYKAYGRVRLIKKMYGGKISTNNI